MAFDRQKLWKILCSICVKKLHLCYKCWTRKYFNLDSFGVICPIVIQVWRAYILASSLYNFMIFTCIVKQLKNKANIIRSLGAPVLMIVMNLLHIECKLVIWFMCPAFSFVNYGTMTSCWLFRFPLLLLLTLVLPLKWTARSSMLRKRCLEKHLILSISIHYVPNFPFRGQNSGLVCNYVEDMSHLRAWTILSRAVPVDLLALKGCWLIASILETYKTAVYMKTCWLM